jgi:hypothetical protein
MSDIKTADRSRMKQATLKHLMLWHSLAKDLSCEQLLVMAILKEFRALSGQHGRHTHRGWTPPKYEYTVKVEVDKD